MKCGKCKSEFVLNESDQWFDEKGFTSTKLTHCPYCGSINVVKYYKNEFENLNDDPRYYDY